MSQHFGQFRSIQLVCPSCSGTLHGTGRVLKQGHVFRCGLCKGVYRWFRSSWRQVYGFELIEQTRVIQPETLMPPSGKP